MLSQRIACLVTIGVVVLSVVGLPGVAADPTASDGFVIERFDAPETVTAGDTVVVNATVRNTGTEPDSQQIHLKNPDDEIVDSVAGPPLTLAPGETETVRLVWQPTAADIGNGSISVQSDDDYPHRSLTVVAPPPTEMTVGSVNSTVTVGEPLSVPISVENTGETTATPDIWIALNGSTATNRTVSVAPGETVHTELTWMPTADEIGSWRLTAGTDAPTTNPTNATLTDRMVTVVSSASNESDDAASTNEGSASDSSGGVPPNVADRLRAPITDGTATFPGGDIRQVAFAADDVAGDVVATRFKHRPAEVEGLADAVGYYRVSVPEAAADRNATIRLQLSTRTLGTTEGQAIGVSHWNGTAWEPLPTTASATDDGMAISVDTERFSVFAVTVAEPAATTNTPTDDDESAENATEDPGSSSEQPTRAASAAVPFLRVGGGLVLLFGVVGLLMGTRRRFRGA
ncbi:CARDB domain-containing protein [Halonotius roseus]|uniref:CARDB domain-containing protein n=1 Tax=Halonotius roseus TaxID=2511997 RepID=A0A544QMZ2_9EURY|nr:CARDB domain-containing protein [Halonotius roseus]TQQ80225.1 hypothetical protein EWF95_06935 [Halonotius roseus]